MGLEKKKQLNKVTLTDREEGGRKEGRKDCNTIKALMSLINPTCIGLEKVVLSSDYKSKELDKSLVGRQKISK